MLIEPYERNKMIIKLSNTESVTQNIYKFTTIENDKETKSTSSTCNYFLTTNSIVAKDVMEILNDPTKQYYFNIQKTLDTALKMQNLINSQNLKQNFKGSLSSFEDSINKLKLLSGRFQQLGKGEARLDGGGKYNLYLNNSNKSVELFRKSIIAVLCDLVIEIEDKKIVLYTILKESIDETKDEPIILENLIEEQTVNISTKETEIIYNENVSTRKKTIYELAKRLLVEKANEESLLEQIIVEAYNELNNIE